MKPQRDHIRNVELNSGEAGLGTVVDQGCLRDEKLIIDLQRRCEMTGGRIALPYYGLVEILKSEHWEFVANQSLRWLAQRPCLVVVLRHPSRLIRAELNEPDKPVELVDDCLTSRLRCALNEHEQGRFSDHFRQIQPRDQVLLDAETARLSAMDLDQCLRRELSEARKKELRKGDLKNLLADLAGEIGEVLCVQALHGAGGRKQIQQAAGRPGICFATVMAWYLRPAGWLATGGLEAQSSEKLVNDRIDDEYVVPGAVCGELLTKDKRARKRHRQLSTLLRMKSEAANHR